MVSSRLYKAIHTINAFLKHSTTATTPHKATAAAASLSHATHLLPKSLHARTMASNASQLFRLFTLAQNAGQSPYEVRLLRGAWACLAPHSVQWSLHLQPLRAPHYDTHRAAATANRSQRRVWRITRSSCRTWSAQAARPSRTTSPAERPAQEKTATW